VIAAPHCTRHSPHATITYQPVARCGQFIFCTGIYFFCLCVFTREVYRGSGSPGPASYQTNGGATPICSSRRQPEIGPARPLATFYLRPRHRFKRVRSPAPAAKSPAPTSVKRRASQLQLPHRRSRRARAQNPALARRRQARRGRLL
jgi:hypothetical protein